MDQPTYSLTNLSIEDLNAISAGLHLLPYGQAHPVMVKFQRNIADINAKAKADAESKKGAE